MQGNLLANTKRSEEIPQDSLPTKYQRNRRKTPLKRNFTKKKKRKSSINYLKK